MKRALKSLAIALALVSVAGPSMAFAAQDTPKEKVKHLTGAVVSVNQDAKTLTVKRMVKQKEHEYTFAASKDAAATLTQLKPGEQVRVSYVEAAGTMTAESIAVVPMTKHAKAPVKTDASASKTEASTSQK